MIMDMLLKLCYLWLKARFCPRPIASIFALQLLELQPHLVCRFCGSVQLPELIHIFVGDPEIFNALVMGRGVVAFLRSLGELFRVVVDLLDFFKDTLVEKQGSGKRMSHARER